MSFVFSVWYFIAIALVAGVVACLLIFFKMDKQDRVLIDQFIKENEQPQEVASTEVKEEVKEEVKTE